MEPDFKSLLREYLSAYWLRPVTALVRALEASILALWCDPTEHAVELACGDGINSLLARGGSLPEDFDAFQSVPLTPPEDFFGGHVDVYDTSPDARSVSVSVVPKVYWNIGLDQKANLLDKARQLGSFRQLIRHDLNCPLPLGSESVSFLFSNSIYWIENVDGLLDEIHRVLRAGATAKLVIINPRFYENMAWTTLEPHPLRRFLDMGRHLHYKALMTPSDWEKKFGHANLHVDRTEHTFNTQLVHMVEFHDYREISPLTAFMAKRLPPADRKKVKQEWIRYAEFLFSEMYQDGFLNATAANSTYEIYTVSK